jgi:hypothetical protein
MEISKNLKGTMSCDIIITSENGKVNLKVKIKGFLPILSAYLRFVVMAMK